LDRKVIEEKYGRDNKHLLVRKNCALVNFGEHTFVYDLKLLGEKETEINCVVERADKSTYWSNKEKLYCHKTGKFIEDNTETASGIVPFVEDIKIIRVCEKKFFSYTDKTNDWNLSDQIQQLKEEVLEENPKLTASVDFMQQMLDIKSQSKKAAVSPLMTSGNV